MKFLGDSQTFIGVLLTLNVLCIFADKDNNFILKFLLDYKDKFKTRLSNIADLIASDSKRIYDSQDYKSLERCSKLSGNPPAIRFKASEILYKYSFQFTDKSISLSQGFAELDKIEKSTEQFRAPLFTLLYGIIIFLVDETCRIWPSEDVFEASTLFGWILTTLSFAYWGLLWVVFLFPNQFSGAIENRFYNFVNKINPLWGGCIKLIIGCLIFILICLLINFEGKSATIVDIILLLSVFLPIFLIGLWREIGCKVKNNYSFMHICGHLVAFTIYAIITTNIAIHCDFVPHSHMGFPENINYLKGLITLFILLNGIILPFAFPYRKYRKLYDNESSKLISIHQEVCLAFTNFEDEIGKFSKEYFRSETSLKAEIKQVTPAPEITIPDKDKVDWIHHIKVYETLIPKISIKNYCKNNNLEEETFRFERNRFLQK